MADSRPSPGLDERIEAAAAVLRSDYFSEHDPADPVQACIEVLKAAGLPSLFSELAEARELLARLSQSRWFHQTVLNDPAKGSDARYWKAEIARVLGPPERQHAAVRQAAAPRVAQETLAGR